MRHDHFYTKFATEVIHVTLNWADTLPQSKICLTSMYENAKMKTTAFVCYLFKNQLTKILYGYLCLQKWTFCVKVIGKGRMPQHEDHVIFNSVWDTANTQHIAQNLVHMVLSSWSEQTKHNICSWSSASASEPRHCSVSIHRIVQGV